MFFSYISWIIATVMYEVLTSLNNVKLILPVSLVYSNQNRGSMAKSSSSSDYRGRHLRSSPIIAETGGRHNRNVIRYQENQQ